MRIALMLACCLLPELTIVAARSGLSTGCRRARSGRRHNAPQVAKQSRAGISV